jgi:hypothetical protein
LLQLEEAKAKGIEVMDEDTIEIKNHIKEWLGV